MYYDVKRRLPYYWSDIRDAFTYRTFAATVRMYFVKYVTILNNHPRRESKADKPFQVYYQHLPFYWIWNVIQTDSSV